MNSHSQTIEELQKHLKTTPEGLSSIEAQNRLKEYGENRLKEAGKKSILTKFLEQFRDVMVLILLAAAAVSFLSPCLSTTAPPSLNRCLSCSSSY